LPFVPTRHHHHHGNNGNNGNHDSEQPQPQLQLEVVLVSKTLFTVDNLLHHYLTSFQISEFFE
ncbi:hypothetical protein HK102_011898, partial [Quaeritorhiza haematococci]